MKDKFSKGYQLFREKYVAGDDSVMKNLSKYGQEPETMIVACCDSRVDPAIILQCDPGDLFTVRNVANIVPKFEREGSYHGTSAALEFGIRFLKVKQLVIMGHSQCGGMEALLEECSDNKYDFVKDWASIVKTDDFEENDVDGCVKHCLRTSYANCMTFPWIKKRVEEGTLKISLWFFDVKEGRILEYSSEKDQFVSPDL